MIFPLFFNEIVSLFNGVAFKQSFLLHFVVCLAIENCRSGELYDKLRINELLNED